MLRSYRTALFSAAAAAILSGSVLASEWPQYRGTNADGVTDENLVANLAKGKAIRPVWKVPIGEGFGTFAVAGGHAFIFVDDGGKETLTSLDPKTGKKLWGTPIDGTISDKQGGSNPRSTPAIDGDNVYVFSVNLKLACLDAKSGKVNWTKDLKREFNGQDLKWGNAASPVIVGDKIFVAGGGGGKSMMAFNKKTGDVVWAVGDEKITHASAVPATIHGIPQVIFFMQSGLVALKQDDGKELWRYKFPYNVSTAANPIVGGKNGDVVYCSAGYDVGGGAVRISKSGDGLSAAEIWRTPKQNVNHWSSAVYRDGHVYGIFGFKEFTGMKGPGAPVKCIDIETGKEKWSQPGFGSGGGTILIGDHLLVQGDGGKLAIIEATPAGYKEKGVLPIKGEKFWCASIVADGKIYGRSKTEAFCYDASGK